MRRLTATGCFLTLAWALLGGPIPLLAQANNLVFNPMSFTFTYQVGAPRPAKQTLTISTTVAGAPPCQ